MCTYSSIWNNNYVHSFLGYLIEILVQFCPFSVHYNCGMDVRCTFILVVITNFFFLSYSLRKLQARVKDARMKSSLFDTREYTLGLETLFTKMWQRKEKGLSVDHIVLNSAHFIYLKHFCLLTFCTFIVFFPNPFFSFFCNYCFFSFINHFKLKIFYFKFFFFFSWKTLSTN